MFFDKGDRIESGGGGRGRLPAGLRLVPWLLALLIASLFAGCSDTQHTSLTAHCEALGICEGAPPAPVLVDILCDRSLGAPCTRETMRADLDVLLPYIAHRPGSPVRFWGQGTDVADTTLLGSIVSSAPPHTGARVKRVHDERFIRSAREELLHAGEAFFQSAPKRRSPIAEGLTLIARTAPPRPGMTRFIVASTDLRQVTPGTGLDFECYPIPTRPERLLTRWHRAQVLTPGSLAGIQVVFTNTALRPVEGRDCPTTLARAVAIESIWNRALRAADATDVRFLHGAVALDDAPPEVHGLHADGGVR